MNNDLEAFDAECVAKMNIQPNEDPWRAMFQAGAAYQREQSKGYDVISPADDSMALTHDGLFVESSDYDQLKAECERLVSCIESRNGEIADAGDTIQRLRKQLDEANAALGAKNGRIAEFAERHLKDFVELERLDKQLDEARELLTGWRAVGRLDGVDAYDWEYKVDAWLEVNK